jgi:hypothetical protein
MYVGHLLVARRTLVEECSGLDSAFDNVQDFELMLRLSERTRKIAHVPRVLYSWRRAPGSVATGLPVKADVDLLQVAAVNEHLRRRGLPMAAKPQVAHAQRVALTPDLGADVGAVTVIVGTFGDERACESTLEAVRNSVARRAVTCVVCGVGEPDGRLARAAVAMLTPYLCYVEAGLHPEGEDWLDQLLMHAVPCDAGVVAPVTLDDNGLVEDAGLFVANGGLLPELQGRDPTRDGFTGSLSCAREVTAISGTAALVSAAALDRIGGLLPLFASPRAAWVDASLRANVAGLRNVVDPASPFRRRGPGVVTGGAAGALDALLLQDRWRSQMERPDPYHSDLLDCAEGGYRGAGDLSESLVV